MATANTTITPTEYLTMLEAHDWYYSYSDDSRVYRAGSDSYKQLSQIATSSKELAALFKAYCNHIHQGAEKPTTEAAEAVSATPIKTFTIHTDVVTAWRKKLCNVQLLDQAFNTRHEAEDMLALVRKTNPKAFIKQHALTATHDPRMLS